MVFQQKNLFIFGEKPLLESKSTSNFQDNPPKQQQMLKEIGKYGSRHYQPQAFLKS
jgi:hypothetical protein